MTMTQNNLYYEKGSIKFPRLRAKNWDFSTVFFRTKMKKTNAIHFQTFQFQIFPPREVYKNLEKVSVLTLRLMAVSVSISRLEKKRDTIKEKLYLGLETINPVSLISASKCQLVRSFISL